MATVEIKITNIRQIRSAFAKAPNLMTANLNKAIRKTIFLIAGKSAEEAPHVRGDLARSHFNPKALTFRNLYGRLQPTVKYAVWVHDGTSPYIIRPRNGGVLVFRASDGTKVFTKKVNHPGIKANPFLRRAVDKSENQTEKFFENAVQDTLDQIAKEANS